MMDERFSGQVKDRSLHRGQWRRQCSPVPRVVLHDQRRVASS